MASPAKRRNDRLEFRLPPGAKSVLKRAADVERKTLSAFLLDKGLQAAAETLADEPNFAWAPGSSTPSSKPSMLR